MIVADDEVEGSPLENREREPPNENGYGKMVKNNVQIKIKKKSTGW